MPSTRTYVVGKGDTLGKIAGRFYGDPARFTLIVAANALANPDKLTVGQTLVIPDLQAPTSPAITSPSPVSAPPAGRSDRTAALSAEKLAGLHPIVTLRGRCMVDLCAQAGLAVLVTQGLRTWAEQDALYAKGRAVQPIGKQHVVTNAKGGQSWHNFGLAFDIVVLDAVGKADWDSSHPGWQKAAELGKSVGLEWGGDWKGFKDMPHFQYTGGLTLVECRKLHAGGLGAVWEKVH
ncbi:MAG: M15 family metallopeptidase [Gemmatimonadetes bacterium]|nr:M15 family metallopeptidase [Gemmatimonadota bacterium]